jgi:hypothetical protein
MAEQRRSNVPGMTCAPREGAVTDGAIDDAGYEVAA